jgi:hypothetical protein
MRDFFEKCLVFGGIALAFWLLTFSRPSSKQNRRDLARRQSDDAERRRNDAADASHAAQNNRHDHHR